MIYHFYFFLFQVLCFLQYVDFYTNAKNYKKMLINSKKLCTLEFVACDIKIQLYMILFNDNYCFKVVCLAITGTA